MKQIILAAAARAGLAALLLQPTLADAGSDAIDVENSVLIVRVYKSGLFSVFAHDHEIRASIARGEVEDSVNPAVEFWVDAGKLRVVDSDISAKDRAEVQRTMEGPEVLDVARFPEIHFRSTEVNRAGADRWIVQGELELHGQRHPVTVEVSESNGRYEGSATLKQRDFAIAPVRIAGGTVKVKDSVKVEFEIAIARSK